MHVDQLYHVSCDAGDVVVRPLRQGCDASVVYSWLSQGQAGPWQWTVPTRERFDDRLAGIASSPTHDAWAGVQGGEVRWCAETYDPAHSPLTTVYRSAPGDRGLRLVLQAPHAPESPMAQVALASMLLVCFQGREFSRVVVAIEEEPAMVHLVKSAGFSALREVTVNGQVRVIHRVHVEDFVSSDLAGVVTWGDTGYAVLRND